MPVVDRVHRAVRNEDDANHRDGAARRLVDERERSVVHDLQHTAGCTKARRRDGVSVNYDCPPEIFPCEL